MNAPLVFLDTETTSLRPDRRAWEIGLIVRQEGHDEEHVGFVDQADLDLGNADLISLRIGRFHERHPQASGTEGQGSAGRGGVLSEKRWMTELEKLTRGAHLVGAVVSFDADVLGQRMRAHGICPSWHYHLIDVEALAVGYFAAHAGVLGRRELGEIPGPGRAGELRRLATPPWKSDELSAALGLMVSEQDRHTALGDARWARDIYDAVMEQTTHRVMGGGAP